MGNQPVSMCFENQQRRSCVHMVGISIGSISSWCGVLIAALKSAVLLWEISNIFLL